MQGTRRDGGMWDGATRNKILYYVIEHKPIDAAVDLMCSVTHMHASSRIYTQDKIPSQPVSQLHKDTRTVSLNICSSSEIAYRTQVSSQTILTSTAAG